MATTTRINVSRKRKSGVLRKDIVLHKAGFMKKPEGIVLPSKHPAANLHKGEFTIKDGVIFEYLPATERNALLVAGVPIDDQPGEIAAPFHLSTHGDLSVLLSQRIRLANWAAEYSGKYLPKKSKEQLRKIYCETAKKAHALDVSVALNKIDKKEAIEKRALLFGDAVSQEKVIFRRHRKAQKHRFGQIIEKRSSRDSVTPIPKNALIGFVSGDYLNKTPEYGKNPLTEKLRKIKELGTDVGKWKEVFEFFEWLEHFYPKEPSTIEIVNGNIILELDEPTFTYEGTPIEDDSEAGPWEVVSSEDSYETIEVRKFVTKNPAWGDHRELIEEHIDNIVHTNLVAGIWKGRQRHVIEQREIRSGDIIVYEHRSYIEFIWDHEWIIGNGNAGWYRDDDDVVMYYCGIFEDEESARRYLLSVRKYDDGEYYANQAAAYAVGQYGQNWVCHQNCNAFAFRKWGEIPFYHPQSWLIWGSCGTGHICSGFQAISPAKDIFGTEFPGGAPGAECLNYHRLPCGADQLQCDQMSGVGFGLKEDPWTNLGNGRMLESNAICENERIPPDFDQLQRWASLNPFRVVANRWWTVS